MVNAVVDAASSIGFDPATLGLLVDSSADFGDTARLRDRMARDGYLFLPGALDRAAVLRARTEITQRLAAAGVLAPGTDLMEAIAATPARAMDRAARAGLTQDNAALSDVLYAGSMMAFFDRFLGEPTRHYDFTWLRAVAPGPGTPVHADVVYMGRAERQRLFTAWTPLGDVDSVQGGLMVLEGSCGAPALQAAYYGHDVDAHCINTGEGDAWDRGTQGWLSRDPDAFRRELGGAWLTAPFRAGDVVIFSVFTVHASLDNRSDRIRLSADSRYQPASKPADERWIGADPPGHGPRGKHGMIC